MKKSSTSKQTNKQTNKITKGANGVTVYCLNMSSLKHFWDDMAETSEGERLFCYDEAGIRA